MSGSSGTAQQNSALAAALSIPGTRQDRLLQLGGIRVLAALCVVLHHLGRHLYPGWQPVGLWAVDVFSWTWGQLIALSNIYVWPSVQFFFLISGFVIHLKAAASLAAGDGGKFSALLFLHRRLQRIYPVLLTAVLLTFICDSLTARFLPGLPAGTPASPELAALQAASWRNVYSLLGTLLFLQPFWCHPYGSNQALWFIGHLGWFYLLYPVYMLFSRRWNGYVALGVSLLIAVVAIFFVRQSGFPLYPVLKNWWQWCLGAFLAEVWFGRHMHRLPQTLRAVPAWAGVFLLAAAALLMRSLKSPSALTGDMIWLPCLGLLLMLFLFSERGRGVADWVTGHLQRLAGSSYMLYATHIPVMMLTAVVLRSLYGRIPGSYLPSLLTLPLVLIIGWAANTTVSVAIPKLNTRQGRCSKSGKK